jgi:exonuclease III
LEGVVRYSKIHRSTDWAQKKNRIYRSNFKFGAEKILDSYEESYKDQVMIYKNSMKSIETSYYPYSELFRDFSGVICKPNSAVVTYGYGFGDTHINYDRRKKMQNINIVEWNINQRISNSSIDAFVSHELTKTKPHIIFVVEYKEDAIFEDTIRMSGYKVFSTGKIQSKNEVLIAIRNDGNFTNIQPNMDNLPKSLDILSICVRFDNRKICLIGARIQVGAGNAADYSDRGKQLNDLLSYVKLIKKSCEYVIIAGDFNHGQIREEDNDAFSYDGYLQEPCSYQKMKKMFEEIECQVYAPEGNNRDIFSWVGKWENEKKGTYGLYYVKEDHLIMSNNLSKDTINYEWDYVYNQNRYADLTMYDYKSEDSGLPDHAKLVATVSKKTNIEQ